METAAILNAPCYVAHLVPPKQLTYSQSQRVEKVPTYRTHYCVHSKNRRKEQEAEYEGTKQSLADYAACMQLKKILMRFLPDPILCFGSIHA